MKKLLILTVILAFVALSANAQISKPFNIYAGAGLSLPMGPDAIKDTYKTGIQGLGGVGFSMGPKFQLVGNIGYNSFAMDWEQLEQTLSLSLTDMSGGSLIAFTIGVDGKFDLGLPAAPMTPFLVGGAGLAMLSISDVSDGTFSVPVSYDATKVYFEFGAGVEFKAGPAFNMFLMGKYVNIATEGESLSYVPVTLGVKF